MNDKGSVLSHRENVCANHRGKTLSEKNQKTFFIMFNKYYKIIITAINQCHKGMKYPVLD